MRKKVKNIVATLDMYQIDFQVQFLYTMYMCILLAGHTVRPGIYSITLASSSVCNSTPTTWTNQIMICRECSCCNVSHAKSVTSVQIWKKNGETGRLKRCCIQLYYTVKKLHTVFNKHSLMLLCSQKQSNSQIPLSQPAKTQSSKSSTMQNLHGVISIRLL